MSASKDGRVVLTVGELDGLILTPIYTEEGGIRFIEITVDSLPGLKMTISTGAALELSDSLSFVLGSVP